MEKDIVYLCDTSLKFHNEKNKVDVLKVLNKCNFDYIDLGFQTHDYDFFLNPPFLENSIYSLSSFARRINDDTSEEVEFKKLLNNEIRIVNFEVNCLDDFNENFSKIEETLKYADPLLKETNIEFNEFFKAYETSQIKALNLLKVALKNNAKRLILVNVEHELEPEKLGKILNEITKEIPLECLGFHCFNRHGYGIDNSIKAIESGIRYIKGSVSGKDDVNFANLLPIMSLKMKVKTNLENIRDIMTIGKFF